MIQEITAQGRNLEEMNVKAEMHNTTSSGKCQQRQQREKWCKTAPVFCKTCMVM